MKKLLLFALAMIMMGCNQQKFADKITKSDFGVCVYDSCEYIIATYGYSGYLAHKGNCKFCAERNKKMIKEQIDTALLEIFD